MKYVTSAAQHSFYNDLILHHLPHMMGGKETQHFHRGVYFFLKDSTTTEKLFRLQVFLLRQPQNAHFFSAPYKVITQFSAETMPNIDMLWEKGYHHHITRGMCPFSTQTPVDPHLKLLVQMKHRVNVAI